MQNVAGAVISDGKLYGYSMNEAHPENGGKHHAWRDLGYDIDSKRREAAEDAVRQLRRHLPDVEPVDREETEYGPRYTTETPITGPNGQKGTMVTIWQYDIGSDVPRMLTHWVEVHTGKGAK